MSAADDTGPLAALDALNDAFARQDAEAALALFSDDAAFIGSEDGEAATGAVALRALLRDVLGRPETYAWRWRSRTVQVEGAIGWVTADADLLVRTDETEECLPYRITGVLQRGTAGWRWCQYHGSEPVPPVVE